MRNKIIMIAEIIEAALTALGIAFITGIALLIAGVIVFIHKTIMKDE
jgi:hypothetical protein